MPIRFKSKSGGDWVHRSSGEGNRPGEDRGFAAKLYTVSVIDDGSVLHCCYVRLRRFVVAAIVAICIGGPIVEMFDRWDHTLQDGNDTEANVVVAALCIGVAMAIGTMVVTARLRALASNSHRHAFVPQVILFAPIWLASPTATTSPPTPLRV
jgi:hypothetical protein